MKNNYKEITIYELNLIFLEFKYNQVTYITYGFYQNNSNIINEYLGNYKVKDVNSIIINNFYNYLKFAKKWKYKEKISIITIKNIMSYLNNLLNQAVFWKIISNNPINHNKPLNTNYITNYNTNYPNLFVKKRHNLLLDLEFKRISNIMNTMLN